jgi:hypothetical protein
MFNLEQAIAEWRRQMLAAGLKTPVPLEELESHLREDVERQMQSGLDAQRAFENSIQRIGPAQRLKTEFKKICGTKRNPWLWFGRFGLAGIVILNLAGRFVFHRSSSVFFLDQWWSAWFPSYIVWMSFIVMGGFIGISNWRTQRKATRQ